MEAASVTVLARPPAAWPAPRPAAAAEAAAYLDGLADEQQRYLTALAALGAQLPARGGDLAALAAGHARLTREFLDAQRAILRRRVDTEAEAAALLIGADPALRIATGNPLPAPSASSRVELGEPTLPAARAWPAPDDAELAALIDGAFEALTAAAERELRALLDGWWARECEENRALLADARARASAARHIAGVEPLPEPTTLPLGDLDVSARHDDSLDDLLDALLRVLEGGPQLPPATSPAAQDETERGDAEHFDRFWKGGPSPADRRSVGQWLLVQVLLPMVSVVAILASVLAVVG